MLKNPNIRTKSEFLAALVYVYIRVCMCERERADRERREVGGRKRGKIIAHVHHTSPSCVRVDNFLLSVVSRHDEYQYLDLIN